MSFSNHNGTINAQNDDETDSYHEESDSCSDEEQNENEDYNPAMEREQEVGVSCVHDVAYVHVFQSPTENENSAKCEISAMPQTAYSDDDIPQRITHDGNEMEIVGELIWLQGIDIDPAVMPSCQKQQFVWRFLWIQNMFAEELYELNATCWKYIHAVASQILNENSLWRSRYSYMRARMLYKLDVCRGRLRNTIKDAILAANQEYWNGLHSPSMCIPIYIVALDKQNNGCYSQEGYTFEIPVFDNSNPLELQRDRLSEELRKEYNRWKEEANIARLSREPRSQEEIANYGRDGALPFLIPDIISDMLIKNPRRRTSGD